MRKGWPIALVAVVAGAATATRAPGIALLPPLLLYIGTRSRGWLRFLLTSLWAVPLACWGLAAYVLYQFVVFGDPLAFARTQDHWYIAPRLPWPEKSLALLTGQPLRAVYDPTSPTYWARGQEFAVPFLNLQFANPLYFLFAVVLTLFGAWKRWLCPQEVALAAGFLLIPYVTRGYDNGMEGMARFSAVVFPVYLVLGRILCWLPQPLPSLLLTCCGVLLTVYAALFASGYRFI